MKAKGGKSIKDEFSYNSKDNKIFLSVNQIKKLINSQHKLMQGILFRLS